MTHSIDILVQILVLLPAVYVGVLYLQEEDGPFDVFKRIRKLAGFTEEEFAEMEPDGSYIEYTEEVPGDNFFSRVLQCHRCLSPYVAFLVSLVGLAVGFLSLTPSILIVWLGLTGSTIYLFEKLGD